MSAAAWPHRRMSVERPPTRVRRPTRSNVRMPSSKIHRRETADPDTEPDSWILVAILRPSGAPRLEKATLRHGFQFQRGFATSSLSTIMTKRKTPSGG